MHVEALEPARVDAYLRRLGVARPTRPDLDALTALQAAHLRTIPFENLSIHLGEPIVLDPAALVDKLVGGRGGFCYELNGAFASLLAALGFDVTLLEARVFDEGRLGIRFDHLTLRVDLDAPHLADVGFGDSFLAPLRLDRTGPQDDAAGAFELLPAGDGHLDVQRDGTAQYRIDLTPRRLDEFADACVHHQSSPDSHFTRGTVCSLATAEGRITISGRQLITTRGGDREQRSVDDDRELLALYEQHFGIALSRVPAVSRDAPTR